MEIRNYLTADNNYLNAFIACKVTECQEIWLYDHSERESKRIEKEREGEAILYKYSLKMRFCETNISYSEILVDCYSKPILI